MNAQDIAGYAAAAGFSGDALRIAIAVAMAESSGNPLAHNTRGADDSYGLWQINMRGALGPQRRAAYGLVSNNDLYEPMTNARIAFSLSNGGSNWMPWGAFTNGSYRRYLPAIVPSQPGPPVESPPVDAGGGDVNNDPVVETMDVGLLSGVPTWLVIAGVVTVAYTVFR